MHGARNLKRSKEAIAPLKLPVRANASIQMVRRQVRQGDVTLSFLWLIFINVLLNELTTSKLGACVSEPQCSNPTLLMRLP